MTGVEALKPSAFVALCDGETPKNCPAKRVAKSLNKTVENFDDTLVVMSRIETSAAVFAAIEGGFDSKMRRMSAEKMSKRSFILFIQKSARTKLSSLGIGCRQKLITESNYS